ncbi:MAG: GNAT family N-acetyltransferase [Caldilineaceae bacterium]|nr:GNAT family N-acetyltransferase [Caldilineaceae bacterium]
MTNVDRAPVQALLSEAPAQNLYLLGNLETLGFDHELCEFWGDWGSRGQLRAVLNRYMTGWGCYGRPDADWPALARVMDDHPEVERLQDNPGGIPSLLPYLHVYRATQVHVEELMALDAAAFIPQPVPAGIHVRRATEADLPALIAFYADAGHMTRRAAAVARPLRDTRLWLAQEAGTVVAAALTNAETANLAMIGGVYTPPAQRGRGLSQAVCSTLCADLLAAQKRPVLYWDTPAAGAVYRKLGFHAVGEWRSIWLEKGSKIEE